MLSFVKGLVKREAARLVAGASVLATGAVLAAANALGVELSGELIAAVGVFAAAVATEAIRHFVYSQATVERIVEEVEAEALGEGEAA